MAHGIELTNGRANMAYTGKTPWHELGQSIEQAFTAETALVEANLDWEVEVAPLYHKDPDAYVSDGMIESTKGKVVRRTDTGDELGVFGPS